MLFGFFGLGYNVVVHADNTIDSGTQTNVLQEPPVKFEDAESIEQVVEEIDNFYLSRNPIQTRAAAGTKWKDGEKVWDGKVGYYVTNYYWVKGNEMVSWNIIGNAQRKAVITKYGSVNGKTSYKMKTTQHIAKTAYQTQGYMTISADAWCYARD
ncbi:hypothetical protein IGJ68_002134 [Enterococcus sp. DIV0564]|uniref:hypothetical protein n=1 Tax=Enterococcus TaxID=1350 RepID=UPI001F61407C|nr:hypothetical protein [Enterococcus faecalis]